MTSRYHYPSYQAQLLRMWREQSAHRMPVWRFSLEDVSTGQRYGFADLEALITHLLALMEERPAPRRCETARGKPPMEPFYDPMTATSHPRSDEF